MKVYIISPKYNYEGLGSPIAAFSSKEEAEEHRDWLNAWKACEPQADYQEDDEDYEEFDQEYDRWRAEFPEAPTTADSFVITELEVN